MTNTIKNYSKVAIENTVESKRESHEDGNYYNKEMSLGAKDTIFLIKKELDVKISSFKNSDDTEVNDENKKYIKIFQKLDKEIEILTKDLDMVDWQFSHEEGLNSLVAAIDNAENEAIKIIEGMIKLDSMNTSVKEQNKALEKNETQNNKNFIDIDDDGIYKLTSDTNPVPIHTVLGNMIENGETWYIDYSDCESAYIKNKMKSALGGSVDGCYLTKGIDSKGNNTYLLSNGEETLTQRALIWNGVKLTPPSLIKKNAHKKLKEIDKNEKKQITDKLTVSKQKKLLRIIPSELKEDIYKLGSKIKENSDKNKKYYPSEFFSSTENTLNQAIIRAKREGYELSTTPISKDGYASNGDMFEIHLINGDGEVDRTLFTEKISPELFDIFDDNESDLVKYLTQRIQQKWEEADYLTQRANILSGNKSETREVDNKISEKITPEEKVNVLRGLGYMSKLVDNLIEDEGDSRDDDDEEFVEMKKYIRNAIYSIQTGIPIKQDIADIINNLYTKFHRYQLDSGTNRKMLGQNVFGDLLRGAKEKSVSAIREIGNSGTIFDNKYTTFLRDEILENNDLEIRETTYNNCFKKIGSMLSIPEGDGPIPENIKQNIDALYTASNNSKGVLAFFKEKGMLPASASFENEKIKEICEKSFNIIKNKKKIIDSFDITSDGMKISLQKQKTMLEIKENKTSEEIISLNSISFLLNDQDALQEQAKQQTETMKDVIKYAGIDGEIKGSIGSRLIKEGGGATGTNSDIYNDSIGAGGLFDRSDENTSKIGPVLKEIAIEVAICVVAIAAGALTAGAGTAAIYGARAAMIAGRTISLASKGKKLYKIMKLAGRASNYKKYYKIGKGMSKTLKESAKLKNSLQMAKTTKNITKVKNSLQIAKTTKNFTKVKNIIASPFTYGAELGKGIQTIARGTAMMIEGTTFHLSSTVMHNTIEGGDLSKGLNPLGYMEGPNGEKIPNWKGYAQSIAFLGVLKGIGQPIQTLSAKVINVAMGKKLSTTAMAKILRSAGSLSGEMGALIGTEQILGLTFDGEFKSMTGNDFIHMFGMVVGLRAYGGMKNAVIKGFKSGGGPGMGELTVELPSGKKHILKESEINAKNAELNRKIENSNKENHLLNKDIANSKKTIKELELKRKKYRENNPIAVGGKTKPGIISKRIKDLNSKKTLLEAEIKKIKVKNESPSLNENFVANADRMAGKNIWVDGVKYTGSKKSDGTLLFKKAGNNSVKDNFTVSSFKQLFEKGAVTMFNTGGKNSSLTRVEQQNHDMRTALKTSETTYLKTRETTLGAKQAELTQINADIITQQGLHKTATARQQRAKYRADGAKKFTKKIEVEKRKIVENQKRIQENEYNNVNRSKKIETNPKLEDNILNTENFEYDGKRKKYEQSGKKDISEMINNKLVNKNEIPESIRKRQETKPEYDANGNPKGVYKTSIEGMQKYLKENKFYKEGEINTVDGKIGGHTKNAINRYQAKTIEAGLKTQSKKIDNISKNLKNIDIKTKPNEAITSIKNAISDFVNIKSIVKSRITTPIKNKLNNLWTKIQETHLKLKLRNFKTGDELIIENKDGKISEIKSSNYEIKNGEIVLKFMKTKSVVVDMKFNIENIKTIKLKNQVKEIERIEPLIQEKVIAKKQKIEYKKNNIEIEKLIPTFDAKTFDGLYKQIDMVGKIQGSEKVYTPKEIKTLIEKVRKGDIDIRYITNKGGLRTKVNELINNNSNKVNINKEPNRNSALKVENIELKRYNDNLPLSPDYIQKSKDARIFFKDRLVKTPKITKENFIDMFEGMHSISAYKGSSIGEIGKIRSNEVIGGKRPWADIYTKEILKGFGFKQDIRLDFEGRVIYAAPKEFSNIFDRSVKTLQEIRDITVNTPGKNNKKLTELLADYHHDVAYARLFGNVNNSLFMNQINFFLKANNMKTINHGHLDHIAPRVSKEQYKSIFKENIKNELPVSSEGMKKELYEGVQKPNVEGGNIKYPAIDKIIQKNHEKRNNFNKYQIAA